MAIFFPKMFSDFGKARKEGRKNDEIYQVNKQHYKQQKHSEKNNVKSAFNFNESIYVILYSN